MKRRYLVLVPTLLLAQQKKQEEKKTEKAVEKKKEENKPLSKEEQFTQWFRLFQTTVQQSFILKITPLYYQLATVLRLMHYGLSDTYLKDFEQINIEVNRMEDAGRLKKTFPEPERVDVWIQQDQENKKKENKSK